MKAELNHLPLHKQAELEKVTQLIREHDRPEMIILFGSYARGDWVEELFEDKYVYKDDIAVTEPRYTYQSDYDLLIIVKTKSEFAQSKIENNLEDMISEAEGIKTPASIIVHDIDFVNRRLKKAQYFFSDIKKEGIILYDSEQCKLAEPVDLSAKERRILAEDDFEYWFDNANEFWLDFQHAFQRGGNNNAAFLLHQVTERLYTGILLVFTRYKPNTHDINVMRKICTMADKRFAMPFPLYTQENRRLFKLLRKAYVDARYKRSYVITQDELAVLAKYVTHLRELGKKVCREKIDSFK